MSVRLPAGYSALTPVTPTFSLALIALYSHAEIKAGYRQSELNLDFCIQPHGLDWIGERNLKMLYYNVCYIIRALTTRSI
jgi:hypothetical protein